LDAGLNDIANGDFLGWVGTVGKIIMHELGKARSPEGDRPHIFQVTLRGLFNNLPNSPKVIKIHHSSFPVMLSREKTQHHIGLARSLVSNEVSIGIGGLKQNIGEADRHQRTLYKRVRLIKRIGYAVGHMHSEIANVHFWLHV